MKNSRKIYSSLQNRLTRKKKNRYFSFQKFHLSYKFDFRKSKNRKFDFIYKNAKMISD